MTEQDIFKVREIEAAYSGSVHERMAAMLRDLAEKRAMSVPKLEDELKDQIDWNFPDDGIRLLAVKLMEVGKK